MLDHSVRLATMLVLLITCSVAAQHDPERNAVRHVAAGQFAKAVKELGKGDSQASENQYVLMLNALAERRVTDAVRHAQKALDAGLPFGRLVAGPRDALQPLYATGDYTGWLQKQSGLKLLHGPMLGRVTSGGASFWVRTAGESSVRVRVFDESAQQMVAQSPVMKTTAASDYTVTVAVNGLEPASGYRYETLIDGQPVATENTVFRTYPRQGDQSQFVVGFGGGAGFVPKWEYMWDTIRKTKPLAFLMLGDNVYIDDPKQDLTIKYCYYRRQSRPEWRRFVAATSMYSIYDDHDFGTNDCVPGAEIDQPPWKRSVWQLFRQNWVNPSYGGGERQPGCWHDFYIGDVHFILLDGRYYRSRKGTPSMLGPVQKRWLLKTLKQSQGTFKVLASPVPWTENIKPGSRDPWDGFAEEREEIFSFLETQRINGVFLVAADRHRTDLRITKRPAGYDLYEFESSRLTNRHTHKIVKTPGLVWGYNKTCSFALMRFDTGRDDPSVTFEARTIDGEKVHDYTLSLSQLRHRKQGD